MIQNGPARGSGMLAMFVDLDDQWPAEFRQWLARDMFTARLAIGFHACASYDAIDRQPINGAAPQQFITTYEMATLGDLYGEPYQGLRRVRDPLDAAFHERFQRPDRYTLSWTGPELSGGTDGFAPVILVDRFDIPPDAAQEFNIWFVTTYLPACDEIPGLLRVRRYLSMEGKPGHFLFHEFADDAALSGSAWQQIRSAPQWRSTTPHPGAPAAYRIAISAP